MGVIRTILRAGFLRSSLHGRGRSDSRLDTNPWILDYEKLGLVWQPYVMRLCRPNQRTTSVSTDTMGFRVSWYRGRELSYDEYRASNDSSVLLGNSAAFGVGASSDASSIVNQLAAITDRRWYNLSGRASNLLQDVLSLLLFGARNHRDIVVMSGVNDLLFALYFKQANAYLPTFWGDDHFASLNSPADSATAEAASPTEEERYARALEGIDRALLLLARYGRENQTRILFAMQPLLAWTEKPLHANEQAVCDEWNAIKSGFRATHRPEIILPWKNRFLRDVAALCTKHGLCFMDFNSQPELLTPDHLFVDRIHLTDRGQRLIAESLARWLQNSATEKEIGTREDVGLKKSGLSSQ